MATNNLSDLFAYAATNYGNHTNWFLRHKEAGFRTLAAVLTAELTIAGFYFSNSLARGVAVAALFLLGVLAIPLTWLAIISCRQSFQASLEHAFMMAKIVTAMGVGERMRSVDDIPGGLSPIGPHDTTLYVPRYLEHAKQAESTEDFVSRGFARTGTTFYATTWTLRIVGSFAAILGIGGSVVALFIP